jgi:hypothetical protein
MNSKMEVQNKLTNNPNQILRITLIKTLVLKDMIPLHKPGGNGKSKPGKLEVNMASLGSKDREKKIFLRISKDSLNNQVKSNVNGLTKNIKRKKPSTNNSKGITTNLVILKKKQSSEVVTPRVKKISLEILGMMTRISLEAMSNTQLNQHLIKKIPTSTTMNRPLINSGRTERICSRRRKKNTRSMNRIKNPISMKRIKATTKDLTYFKIGSSNSSTLTRTIHSKLGITINI